MKLSHRKQRSSQSFELFRVTQKERQKVDVPCTEVCLGRIVGFVGLTKPSGLRVELSPLSCYYLSSETSRVQLSRYPKTARLCWITVTDETGTLFASTEHFLSSDSH